MPTPTFQCLSIDQFRQLVQQFTFTRRITAVHMHHTWRPRRIDFRGHDTIVGMWRHHTQVNGWSDIAQHLTIDPEGMLWLGRNWNRAPASANGHNGNSAFGPFMFEMVGDFDTGREPFDGPQRMATLEVIAAVQQRFELATDTLRFHNMMSSKSCPGTSIRYEEVLAEVDAIKQRAAPPAPLAGRRRGNARAAAPREPIDPVVRDAIAALARPVPAIDEPGDAELAHDAHEAHAAEHAEAVGLPSSPAARGGGLTPDQLARLRPHLVNLRAGRFSDDGIATTTPADVDAIFDTHLPRWLQAQDPARPLNLLFYAHGGLVDEAAGLQIAHKQVDWWIRNGVYPIHFVWETGFLQILLRLLRGQTTARGLDPREHLTDPALELLAHTAGGVQIWGAMKADAERASAAPTPSHPLGGGAHYVARRLKAFCDAHPGRLALHAVGHSAGAVFHAHFLTLARQLAVPRFQAAHFFAPAVRVDTLKDTLLPLVGDGAQHAVASLTLFTMRREHERRDHCGHVYGKSLLYLIHHALEDRRDTPILGLEDSLRADAELRTFFGLAGAPAPHGEVVWAPTAASGATSHGGFDDDGPTMNSLARRVLGRDDMEPIVDFPAPSSRSITPAGDADEPDDSIDALATPALPATAGNRRRALCIGIDAYPEPADRLGGCVNDARNWGAALDALGFETRLLLDDAATRSGIQAALRALIEGSRAGDVLVLQYAGHGTHVDDLEGDEDDGQDEALCPVDFREGALFLDDDIARLLARVPEGVNMTLFMDCCHSGTIARFAVGAPARPAGAKARYVRPTAELQQAHRDFRTLHGTARAAAAPARGRVLRDVKFSACQDHQVALESNGSGEFTLRALRLLRAGIAGLSHVQFQQRLVEAFGPNPPQSPRLDCADGVDSRPLLQPLTGGGAVDGPARAPAAAPSPTPLPAAAAASGERTLQAVHLMARAIETLTAP